MTHEHSTGQVLSLYVFFFLSVDLVPSPGASQTSGVCRLGKSQNTFFFFFSKYILMSMKLANFFFCQERTVYKKKTTQLISISCH